MDNKNLDPAKIGSPTNLLGALFLYALLVLAAMLGSAAVMSDESGWIRPTLVIASIVLVFAPLPIVYRIMTKHREQMLDDQSIIQLRTKMIEVSPKLEKDFRDSRVEMEDLLSGRAESELSVPQQARVQSATEDLLMTMRTIRSINATRDPEIQIPPNSLLQAAKGLMAQRRWTEAADILDAYAVNNDDWKTHWSRGVVRANERGGPPTDTLALRAYSDAIAVAPSTASQNDIARLHVYRAAILKRLSRLDEAEADLNLASTRATSAYELRDIKYNEACIYAMTGRRRAAITALTALAQMGSLEDVRAHVDDYFSSLRDDDDFQRLISLGALTPGGDTGNFAGRALDPAPDS